MRVDDAVGDVGKVGTCFDVYSPIIDEILAFFSLFRYSFFPSSSFSWRVLVRGWEKKRKAKNAGRTERFCELMVGKERNDNIIMFVSFSNFQKKRKVYFLKKERCFIHTKLE